MPQFVEILKDRTLNKGVCNLKNRFKMRHAPYSKPLEHNQKNNVKIILF